MVLVHGYYFHTFYNHASPILFVFVSALRSSSPMHWRIISVGKPGHPWVKEALEMYWKRLRHHTRLEHVVIKEAPVSALENQIMHACSGSLCILLDERGRQLRSVELARWIEDQEVRGRRQVCFVVGGADGHSPALRAKAEECWALSSFTLQHDIALIVVAEQLYRAYSILRGTPYHRE